MTRMGKMPEELRFRGTEPYWIVVAENGTFTLKTLVGEILPQKVHGFRVKPYTGPTPPNTLGILMNLTPRSVAPLRVESSSDEEPTM